jgi:hypothetical protein
LAGGDAHEEVVCALDCVVEELIEISHREGGSVIRAVVVILLYNYTTCVP